MRKVRLTRALLLLLIMTLLFSMAACTAVESSDHHVTAVSEDTFLKIVSGKDWIIPFWKKVITKTAGGKLKLRKETWKFKLVDFCSLDRLENLKQKIITTVKA